MIGNAIYTTLSANATITNLISDRIRPGFIPQGENLASIVYVVDNQEKIEHKDDLSSVLDIIDIQIRIYHDDLNSCNTIAEQVRNDLDGLNGSIASVNIQEGYFTGQEIGDYVSEYELFLIEQTYRFRVIQS